MKIESKGDPKRILSRLAPLLKQETLVGIPMANAPRTEEEEEKRKDDGTPLTNAEIGYIHEYGVPEVNIPERAFLRPGIRSVKDRIAKIMGNGLRATLKGSKDAPQVALMKVGLVCESAVRNKITDGPFQPLSPRTLAARKSRGREGERPLIDTGQLRRSITFVIRSRADGKS